MSITYKDAGVDIDAGESLVDKIKPIARSVQTKLVLDGIGGFAGLLRMPPGMHDPVLVSGTDGVGTKLEVAFALGRHDTVGIDLVAMCVNDIITVGASPLFFLDYFAVGALDVAVGEAVVRGVAEGCKQAGCALLGGETAEMPGMYQVGKYDLAGFAVGVVERDQLLDGRACRAGDAVIAVASSGLHSNGYSLARRVVQHAGAAWDDQPNGLHASLGETMLAPTRIYASAVHALLSGLPQGSVRALSHITGGGLAGNLPRVLPEGLSAELDLSSYTRPGIFSWLASAGPVSEQELRRTFNLGVGLCVVVEPSVADAAMSLLAEAGEHAWRIGKLLDDPGAPDGVRVRFVGDAT